MSAPGCQHLEHFDGQSPGLTEGVAGWHGVGEGFVMELSEGSSGRCPRAVSDLPGCRTLTTSRSHWRADHVPRTGIGGVQWGRRTPGGGEGRSPVRIPVYNPVCIRSDGCQCPDMISSVGEEIRPIRSQPAAPTPLSLCLLPLSPLQLVWSMSQKTGTTRHAYLPPHTVWGLHLAADGICCFHN